MNNTVRIGIIGDYNSPNRTHRATIEAIHHAADSLAMTVEIGWLPTPTLLSGQGKESVEQLDGQLRELFAHGSTGLSLTYSGTHRGQLLGIAATGKRVQYAGAAMFRFQDHRIREVWVLGDAYGLIKQLSGTTT